MTVRPDSRWRRNAPRHSRDRPLRRCVTGSTWFMSLPQIQYRAAGRQGGRAVTRDRSRLLEEASLAKQFGSGKREVFALCRHQSLALATENVQEKLLKSRLNRRVRRAIQLNEDAPGERIRSALNGFFRTQQEGAFAGCGKGNRLHSGFSFRVC